MRTLPRGVMLFIVILYVTSSSPVLSPDGGQVYVAHTGLPIPGISVFARAGDGALTAVQLESEEGIRPFFLVTSDDGKNVYSFVGDGPADRVLRTFSRNNAGQIQFVDSLLLRSGASPGDLGLSPDGRHAYVVYQTDSDLLELARDSIADRR